MVEMGGGVVIVCEVSQGTPRIAEWRLLRGLGVFGEFLKGGRWILPFGLVSHQSVFLVVVTFVFEVETWSCCSFALSLLLHHLCLSVALAPAVSRPVAWSSALPSSPHASHLQTLGRTQAG